MASRVALIAPVPLASPTGNAVTVARVADGLAARGVEVRVRHAAEGHPQDEREPWTPDLIHAFHAFRSGPLARDLAAGGGVPLVVTLTGTDVSHDLPHAERGAVVHDVLRAAAAVTVFHESVAEVVRAALPAIAPRLAVVAQSVCAGASPARPGAPAIGGDPCLLFPAGIRPVKQPLLPLAALDELAARRPGLRLWYVGPVLDPAEHARLEQALARRAWARHLGAVPHAKMAGLLAAADVVLNCSESEGGMANAVLEALAQGRAVLASDIPGNRSLITDGVTGLLFDSAAALARGAERLAADPALRQRLGEAGRRLVRERFSPAAEVSGYLAVYARVAPGPWPR